MSTPYSLAYLDFSDAVSQSITYCSILNKHGEVVVPSRTSIALAIVGIGFNYETKAFIDSPAAGAYSFVT